jgi:hypothetical protein
VAFFFQGFRKETDPQALLQLYKNREIQNETKEYDDQNISVAKKCFVDKNVEALCRLALLDVNPQAALCVSTHSFV